MMCLFRRFNKRVISDICHPELGPYMVRYYLFRSPYLNIYVHKFLRSDNDRHLHDHPFDFITFLFHRGYYEKTEDGKIWRPRFSILKRKAEWKHAVEITQPTWTLFIRFARRRQWGFWTESGWKNWIDYGNNKCEDEG